MPSIDRAASAGCLEIAPSGRFFTQGGRPFLYAADTAWSAPTNAGLDEWRAYLRLRAAQGFTAVQMNLLPQWDRGIRAGDPPYGLAEPPFAERGGSPDYGCPNEAYFARVDAFVAETRAQDLLPALVVFWADYVAGN
ncbi:MAG: DUF4038 domain-containing protein, partial [Spirochaetaceae bacterium]|nr:DUF4038 domain-containing protein [Spirochaetaceae bacterium]